MRELTEGGAANQPARFQQFRGMWRFAGAAILSLSLASGHKASSRVCFLEAGVEEIVYPLKSDLKLPGNSSSERQKLAVSSAAVCLLTHLFVQLCATCWVFFFYAFFFSKLPIGNRRKGCDPPQVMHPLAVLSLSRHLKMAAGDFKT